MDKDTGLIQIPFKLVKNEVSFVYKGRFFTKRDPGCISTLDRNAIDSLGEPHFFKDDETVFVSIYDWGN